MSPIKNGSTVIHPLVGTDALRLRNYVAEVFLLAIGQAVVMKCLELLADELRHDLALH